MASETRAIETSLQVSESEFYDFLIDNNLSEDDAKGNVFYKNGKKVAEVLTHRPQPMFFIMMEPSVQG